MPPPTHTPTKRTVCSVVDDEHASFLVLVALVWLNPRVLQQLRHLVSGVAVLNTPYQSQAGQYARWRVRLRVTALRTYHLETLEEEVEQQAAIGDVYGDESLEVVAVAQKLLKQNRQRLIHLAGTHTKRCGHEGAFRLAL